MECLVVGRESFVTRIVGLLDLLAPDGARDEEPLLEEGVDQVGGFGVRPAQELESHGGLLGPVAALEPGLQGLQLLGCETCGRRGWRDHHLISHDDDGPV